MPDECAGTRPLACAVLDGKNLGVRGGGNIRRTTQSAYSFGFGDPHRDLAAIRQVELGEYVLYMVLGGTFG